MVEESIVGLCSLLVVATDTLYVLYVLYVLHVLYVLYVLYDECYGGKGTCYGLLSVDG